MFSKRVGWSVGLFFMIWGAFFFKNLFAFRRIEPRKPRVYVYNDEGAAPVVVEQALRTLNLFLGDGYRVGTLNAEELKRGDWRQDAKLLVMPGGADLPYAKKLNGEGNALIRSFVEGGGAYLGFCAGAYYACDFIEFYHEGALVISEERELKFFPGKGIGPLAPYDPDTNSGARAFLADISFEGCAGQFRVYYNGGPRFEVPEELQASTVEVLGRYSDPEHPGLPSLVYMPVGVGRVVLSSFHFECDPHTFDSNDADLQKIAPMLKKDEAQRRQLIAAVFRKLGLDVSPSSKES